MPRERERPTEKELLLDVLVAIGVVTIIVFVVVVIVVVVAIRQRKEATSNRKHLAETLPGRKTNRTQAQQQEQLMTESAKEHA